MSDESLFREVDEEVRREQMEKLWKRYGNWFIAFSLGLVVAVAAFKGWQYYQARQAEAAGVSYITALNLHDQGKTEEAELRLADLASGSQKGVAALAKMQQAGIAARKGKPDDAIRIYKTIAADTAIDRPLRDAARVRHAWLIVDTVKTDELKQLLAGLDVAGNPWRASAREILALAAWRGKDYKTMKTYLSAIVTDPETPPGARQRAQIMLGVITPKLAKKG